ncbi:cyclin-dependent kinase 2-interacting protein [Acyrthosiphon pisum]|uniref:ACYPI003198 protein n=1 Tax=Acyrthosiphon pisum TaxID=7029 RepID=C4WTA7_ACYPI|nr:cyclin-dependent kinase 2-interacting protein [Acyrthosiphon pisum]BAH71127.1 ACYPI003198 [Acyrthosiphon pisum]|eukprot:NP_001192096.1 cyclin-dependent kinase 2-interacting protein [Acyrthosiphon pisum]
MSDSPRPKGLNTSIVGKSSPAREVDVHAGRPAQGHSGNLTGNRRILKDTAADIFNRMQQWKIHQDRGCVVISNIFNLRMEMSNIKFPDQLEGLVKELKKLCEQMFDIVEGLKIKLKNLTAVSVLEKGNSTPLFISWTTEHFCKVTEKILRAYQKEHKLHQSLLLRIADNTDPDILLFYLSCWTYQPYLDHSIEKELHCMIKETRHV